jgi:hypothetical protein
MKTMKMMPGKTPGKALKTPLGDLNLTQRGFECIVFEDRYEQKCSLQQSSIFDDEHASQPGATAVWLGIDRQTEPRDGMFDSANLTRMHLDRKGVQALVAVLETWLKCGSFAEDKPK